MVLAKTLASQILSKTNLGQAEKLSRSASGWDGGTQPTYFRRLASRKFTYPTKREKENHRLKMDFSGDMMDMLVPRRVTNIFFGPPLPGGIQIPPLFSNLSTQKKMRGKEKTLLHCQKHLPNG